MLIAIVTGVVSMIPFLSSVGFEFLDWDDPIQIIDNIHIRALSSENFAWMFTNTSHALRYTPLSWINWALIYRFCALDPRVYHAESVVLHGLNAALLFYLIRNLMSRSSDASMNKVNMSAVFGTFLWSLHPMRAETVAWVTQSRYGLALFFFLSSLLFYIRLHSVQSTDHGKTLQNLYFLSGAISMLIYPIAAGLFAILIALDIYPLRRLPPDVREWPGSQNRNVLAEKIPLFALGFTVGIIAVVGRMLGGASWPPMVSLNEFGIFARIMQGFYVAGYYLWKPLIPLDLNPTYLTLFSFEPASTMFIGSALSVTIMTIVVVAKARRMPALAALWISYVVLVSPVLGMMEVGHVTCDRYAHIVMIPFVIIAARLFLESMSRRGWTRYIATAAFSIPLMLGVSAEHQTRIWKNDLTLFTQMLALAKDHSYSGDIHWRLGKALLSRNRSDEAIPHFDAALSVRPDHTVVSKMKGHAQINLGDYAGAQRTYEEALKYSNDPVLHRMLAITVSKH